MRYGGLVMIINQGVKALDDPLVNAYRKAIILGSIREDVSYIPVARKVVEHLSLSHFYKPPLPGGYIPLLWPGARYKTKRYFNKATRAHAQGRHAEAFVQLGRAAHLLVDMACPAHVHRKLHQNDLFEWYVDAHRETLEALPLPHVEPCKDATEVIYRMASFTAQFPADPTQHHVGRVLKKHGILKAIPREDIAHHAHAIIPMGGAFMRELLRLFVEGLEPVREGC